MTGRVTGGAVRAALSERKDDLYETSPVVSTAFLNGRVTLHAGDCLAVLPTLDENSIDSCVTDPPYFLTSIVKRFGANGAAPAQFGKDGRYARLSGGFMQKLWDAPEVPVIDPAFANWMAGFIDGEGCFSVHKKQVNGCETYDCQFSINLRADDKPILVEMQRQLGGIGSMADRPSRSERGGEAQARFCVSSKADCQRLRAILSVFPLRAKKARDFEIWCHALDAWGDHAPKSSWEDVAYFRDQLMAVRNFGSVHRPERLFYYRTARELLRVLKPGGHALIFGGSRTFHHMACGVEDAGFEIRDTILFLYGSGFPKSRNLDGDYDGWGTALKPAMEMIGVFRKPLSEKSIAANVLRWGTGAINVDGCRIGIGDDKGDWPVTARAKTREILHDFTGHSQTNHSTGRWPANVIHDGSDEVVEAFPHTASRQDISIKGESSAERDGNRGSAYGMESRGAGSIMTSYGDEGSASRFFYSSKADSDDRLGSKHPTVKPLDLMQYLVRLVTPPKGLILDPFAGTGTTGEAAWREGFNAILIEREPEYLADIERRMGLCLAGPDERARESIKARQAGKPQDHGPLFEERQPSLLDEAAA